MRHLLALLLLVCLSVDVCAEAVLTIKGKGRKITLRPTKRGGAVIDKQGSSTVVTLRPRRDFETIKLTFKVLADDEFSFSLAGSYSKDKKIKKQYFEWVDCNLFRVGGKELIGPKAEKEDGKKISVAKSQAVKGTVQAKRGDKLEIELSLRLTPREEARKLSDTAGLSEEQKERLKRREEREKQAKALKDLEDEAARERASGKRTFGYVPKKTDGNDQPAEEEKPAKGKKKKKGKAAKSQTAETTKPAKGEAKEKSKGGSKDGEPSDEAGNSGSGAEENGADGE